MKLTNALRDQFVDAVMADVPFVDYRSRITECAIKHILLEAPPAVAMLWNDESTRGWVFTGVLNATRDHVPAPRGDYWVENIKTPEFAALVAARTAQREARDALKDRLRGAAKSVTTTEGLLKLLPEFAKYIPEGKALDRSVPAIANLAADFMKAGWPK